MIEFEKQLFKWAAVDGKLIASTFRGAYATFEDGVVKFADGLEKIPELSNDGKHEAEVMKFVWRHWKDNAPIDDLANYLDVIRWRWTEENGEYIGSYGEFVKARIPIGGDDEEDVLKQKEALEREWLKTHL